MVGIAAPLRPFAFDDFTLFEERDDRFAPLLVLRAAAVRFAPVFAPPAFEPLRLAADFFDADERLLFDDADRADDLEVRFDAALLPAALFVDADFFDVRLLAALFFDAPVFDDFEEVLRLDEADAERFAPLFDDAPALRFALAFFDAAPLFRAPPRERELLTSTDLRSTSLEKRLFRWSW